MVATRPQPHEEALRQSEEVMRLMVEAVRDYAIFMLDPDGFIRSWNMGAERLKGYKAGEIIGKHFSIFYTEEAKPDGTPARGASVRPSGRSIRRGRVAHSEGRNQFWANVLITAFFDQRGRHLGFTKVTRDLTERREAEEKLRRSEERLRLLIDSVPDYAIFRSTPKGVSRREPGRATHEGLHGRGDSGQALLHFLMRRKTVAGVTQPTSSGRPSPRDPTERKVGGTARMARAFGRACSSPRIRDEHGRHLGFAKVTRDMTERRRTEELLLQSEERLRLLFENVQDYAIYMLDPEGNVVSWNAVAEKIKGYRADEIIGKHFSAFYLAEDAAAGRPERELQLAKAVGRHEDEGWRLRKNGERFWANVVISAGVRPQERASRVRQGHAGPDGTAQDGRRGSARRAGRDAGAHSDHRSRDGGQDRDEFISVAAHELKNAAHGAATEASKHGARSEKGER